MATLKDVALRANVSKMTVSRVINHPQLVTDELKALVHKAMEELDYRPNVAAKALAKNRTLVVKLLILEEMDTTEPYYMNLITGIAKELDKYHYALQLITENTLDFSGSDGLIITGARLDDLDWIKSIQGPLILFGENTNGIPFVDSDNKKATTEATEYAIAKGYDAIEFIGIDVPERFEIAREEGYKEVMAKYGKHAPVIHHIGNHASQAEQLIIRSASLTHNTCFICASDRIGLGVVRGLRHLGYKVPDDVGVIGFDGIFLDRISQPRLTTMTQDVIGMGRECVRQLMNQIENNSTEQRDIYFDAKLTVRQTTRD